MLLLPLPVGQRLQRMWTSCLYANGFFTAKSRSTLMPRKLKKDAARLIFCTLVNTWQRVDPKGHICSLSARVMRGMMSPTKMSASASEMMNMWKRCLLSLGQRRMTTIKIMLAIRMRTAVQSLRMLRKEERRERRSTVSQQLSLSPSPILLNSRPVHSDLDDVFQLIAAYQ